MYHFCRFALKFSKNWYLIYDFLDLSFCLNINQSGFRPGDSDIPQLIAVSHNIFTTFDANPSLDVCSDFRDFSKAFDRVWNKSFTQVKK